MLIHSAHAQDAITAAATKPNMITQLLPFIPIVVIFYFLMIRPQQKKAKQHLQLLQSLKKGDQVVTTSGIIATIIKNNEAEPFLIAEIAENTRIKLKREAIVEVMSQSAAVVADATPAVSTPKKTAKKKVANKA